MKTERWLLALLLVPSVSCDQDGDAVEPGETFRLVWSDEFDGNPGTPPSSERWVFDTGIGPGMDGWGNNELQYYTDDVTNAFVDDDGILNIVALRQSFMGRDFTSARLTTKGRFAQAFGRFEARMKLPEGSGIWPAFWMLGDNFPETEWPFVGEIDIMEIRGSEPRRVLGSLHGPGFSAANSISRSTLKADNDGPSFSEEFHILGVEWDEGRIAWYYQEAPDDDPNGLKTDRVYYGTIPAPEVDGAGDWIFNRPFFLLLNLAIGGNFVGPVGPSTPFPATLQVDYVRVFERVPPSEP